MLIQVIYPLFSFQYVAKNNTELHQRAIPKQAPVLTIVDERDDSIERKVERIPTIAPVASGPVPEVEDVTSQTQPEANPAAADVAAISDETPHVQVETEESRQARLDRQWKQVKVDVADLPDIYGRLAKIKLTGIVHCTFW